MPLKVLLCALWVFTWAEQMSVGACRKRMHNPERSYSFSTGLRFLAKRLWQKNNHSYLEKVFFFLLDTP